MGNAKTGKTRALQIELDDTVSKHESRIGERFQGTVKKPLKDGVWGWAICPDLNDMDVFIHRQEANDVDNFVQVQVGAEIIFELGKDERSGRLRAYKIDVLSMGDDLTDPAPLAGMGAGKRALEGGAG